MSLFRKLFQRNRKNTDPRPKATVPKNEEVASTPHNPNMTLLQNQLQLLVDGYIRPIEQKIFNKIIPSIINDLVWKYSLLQQHQYFVVFSDKGIMSYNFSSKKTFHYKFNYYPMSRIPKCNFPGFCYIENQYIPKSIGIPKNKYLSNYNVLIRVGGNKNDKKTDDCDMIIFEALDSIKDDNKNDKLPAYYSKLPNINTKLSSPGIIHHNNNIFKIGGLMKKNSYSFNSRIEILSMDSISLLKWEYVSTPISLAKYSPSSILINDTNLFIFGGCNQFATPCNTTELYKFNNNKYLNKYNSNKSIKLSAMKYRRAFGNICSGIGYDNNRIVMGGGIIHSNPAKTIEIYDINKNKWILYPHQTNVKHHSSALWLDESNKNLLYTGGFSEKVEFIDIRQNTKWTISSDIKTFYNNGGVPMFCAV